MNTGLNISLLPPTGLPAGMRRIVMAPGHGAPSRWTDLVGGRERLHYGHAPVRLDSGDVDLGMGFGAMADVPIEALQVCWKIGAFLSLVVTASVLDSFLLADTAEAVSQSTKQILSRHETGLRHYRAVW